MIATFNCNTVASDQRNTFGVIELTVPPLAADGVGAQMQPLPAWQYLDAIIAAVTRNNVIIKRNTWRKTELPTAAFLDGMHAPSSTCSYSLRPVTPSISNNNRPPSPLHNLTRQMLLQAIEMLLQLRQRDGCRLRVPAC